VPNGRIASIDSAAAERAPGAIAVVTHRNAPRLAYRAHKAVVDPDVGERLHVLQDDRVSHQGQPIALVVANTLEQAVHAATLVRVTYALQTGTTDISRVQPVLRTREQTDQPERRPPETRRGDAERLPGGGRAFWLEPAQSQTALDARRALADRLGHGERHLSNEPRTRFRKGTPPPRWHRGGHERGERHGAGHLDVDDAGGGCSPRPP